MTITGYLDRRFGLSDRGTDVRTEFRGALLVFLSMSYIMVVNPHMMVDAGMDMDACFTATVLMTIFGCLVMGLYANFPVVQAPAMGVNAFFVYTVVIGMGYKWDTALAAVFLSGLIFLIISLTGLRERFMAAIPDSMRRGIAAGIGCFIVLIGLHNSGLIVSNPSTLVSLGDLGDAGVLLSLFCFLLTILLTAMKVKLAIFYGMVVTSAIGLIIGVITVPDSLITNPALPNIGSFIEGFRPDIFNVNFLMVIISILFVTFFDSTGTLMAVSGRAGLDKDGKGMHRAFISDSASASLSGVMGCTPCTAYAESSIGVEAGCRTGLTPVFVALFFVVALFVGPVFSMIDFHCIVGAMFMVGVAMITELKHVDWSDRPLTICVLSMLLFMLLTFSITNGIAFGIITYCIAMIGSRRGREVNAVIYAVAVISVVYLLMIAVNF